MNFLQKIKDIDFGPNWDLYQTSLTELVKRQRTFQINHSRQRKYLYTDKAGGLGHEWQRKVFVSLIMGVPFPNFEIHIDTKTNIIWIEDGQQRYKTFYAIISDMVKLPSDLLKLGDEYSQYSGMCFSELPMKLQDKIYNQQILLLSGNNLTQEELHKRFLLINNGTPLSQQDKRSAQISAGAAYIQGIVDGIPEKGSKLNELSPKLKMFKMQESKFSYVNVSPRGRALEEVVAHWYNMLHQGDAWQINQTQLNKLYNKFFEEGTIKHENYFNKILSQVDKCVCNYTQPSEIKGRPLLLLFYMVKHYMDSGYKINTASFVKNYLSAISVLKTKNKIITYTKPNGENDSLDFGRLLRISQGMDQIGPLTDVILGEISKIQKPIIVDSRRTFSRDEKISKLMEQDSSCGYCGIDLQIENAIGDHMIPHSHGGETSMDNLVVSCNKCNSMKSSLPYDLWETLIPSLKDRNKNN
jgi:hypothetical protein